MKLEEAIGTLALAEGEFTEVSGDNGSIRVKYTGTSPEEEGRVLQALIVYSEWIAASLGTTMSLKSLTTDAVHSSATPSTHASEEEA